MKIQTFSTVQFDAESRLVSGFAVPYGQPTQHADRRQFMFEAGSIQHGERVELTVQHDASRIIGAMPDTVTFQHQDKGIYATARLLDTTEGRDAAANVAAGVLKGYSVEVSIDKTSVKRFGNLLKVGKAFMTRLSLVGTPAFEGAQVAMMSLFEDLPDLGELEPEPPAKVYWPKSLRTYA